MDLLKKETGIDVKSASSSIEEIVARQFVERQARKRQINLPHGPLFADTPVAKKPGAKGKTPEPPKPAAPTLRPRLIKTIKPAATEHAEPALEETAPVVEVHPEPEPEPVVAPIEVRQPEPPAEVHVHPEVEEEPAAPPPVIEPPAAQPAARAAVEAPAA